MYCRRQTSSQATRRTQGWTTCRHGSSDLSARLREDCAETKQVTPASADSSLFGTHLAKALTVSWPCGVETGRRGYSGHCTAFEREREHQS